MMVYPIVALDMTLNRCCLEETPCGHWLILDTGPVEFPEGNTIQQGWFLDTGCLWIPLLMACSLSSIEHPASAQ